MQITFKDAADAFAKTAQPFAELFNNEKVSIELYKPDTVDCQEPHMRDEFYIITAGSGNFVLEDANFNFTKGDLFFVPAGKHHKFVDFTNDFSTWVIFINV